MATWKALEHPYRKARTIAAPVPRRSSISNQKVSRLSVQARSLSRMFFQSAKVLKGEQAPRAGRAPKALAVLSVLRLVFSAVFQRDQTICDCEFSQAGHRVNLQSPHNSLAVGFDGPHANT